MTTEQKRDVDEYGEPTPAQVRREYADALRMLAEMRAELDAARAREQALAESFDDRVKWIVEARWLSAEAREAKIREALTKTTANLRHAYANLFSTAMSADDTRRFADGLIAPEIRRLEAALAEGEDTRG